MGNTIRPTQTMTESLVISDQNDQPYVMITSSRVQYNRWQRLGVLLTTIVDFCLVWLLTSIILIYMFLLGLPESVFWFWVVICCLLIAL